MTMGTTKSTDTPVTAITEDSTATETFYAAIDNFYGVGYVSTYPKGNVETTLRGLIDNSCINLTCDLKSIFLCE